MTVQCYTPTPQCHLCSQHFCVQFLSILTWSWSWRWTPRRECLDPNCVRSDGCRVYKCGYRLPASPPVKIFKVYVLKHRVWTNTQTNKQTNKQTLFITTGPWKVNAICVKKYTQNNSSSPKHNQIQHPFKRFPLESHCMNILLGKMQGSSGHEQNIIFKM
jgi:hypothetical protein